MSDNSAEYFRIYLENYMDQQEKNRYEAARSNKPYTAVLSEAKIEVLQNVLRELDKVFFDEEES